MTAVGEEEVAVRVRAMRAETDDIMLLELEPVAAEDIGWQPGSHVDLIVPGAPVRQYSLCGRSGSGSLHVAVRLEALSRGGSRAVHERVRPGDVIAIRGPRNHFELVPAPDYLFVAGGIGITPILPMLRAAAASGASWRLLYLGSSRRRMAFLAELAEFGDRVEYFVGDEGRRADLGRDAAPSPPTLVYACGPEAMLAELETLGMGDRLRTERFSAPVVDFRPGAPFTVRLERSGLEITVPPEQSILAAMRSAGVSVLSDCEEGICGSCETRVIEGEVDHRDYVLTVQEKKRNDCAMVCVSRANCPILVLDA